MAKGAPTLKSLHLVRDPALRHRLSNPSKSALTYGVGHYWITCSIVASVYYWVVGDLGPRLTGHISNAVTDLILAQ